MKLRTRDTKGCKFFIADRDACVIVVGVNRRSDDEAGLGGRACTPSAIIPAPGSKVRATRMLRDAFENGPVCGVAVRRRLPEAAAQ